MARFHKGVYIGAAGVAGVATILAWGVPQFGGALFDAAFGGEEEPKAIVQEPAFEVTYGQEPRPVIEPAPEQKEPTLTEKVREAQARREPAAQKQQKKQTLTEKWLENVNSGGMYAFGEDSGTTQGAYNANGECAILQPTRVRAMIADSATTDEPGMAIGQISEDVQGTNSDGEWCVAIPGGSIVAYTIGKAGDYATDRAPVKVEKIWMEDGFEVVVGQPAKHINGVPGPIGKANHHVAGKTFAAIAGGAFQLINNLTQIGQFNSSDATDPFEDMIRKKLEQPAEITLDGGKTVEFDLLPTSTPGY